MIGKTKVSLRPSGCSIGMLLNQRVWTFKGYMFVSFEDTLRNNAVKNGETINMKMYLLFKKNYSFPFIEKLIGTGNPDLMR